MLERACLIWIAGSINAGKSTVAGRLATMLAPAVHIEVDHLMHMGMTGVPFEVAIPHAMADAVVLAKRWIARDILPIASFPLSAGDAAFIQREAGDLPICCLTLDPGEDVAGTDRGERVLDDWEKARVRVMYRELGLQHAHLGIRIDNRRQTVDETVAEAIAYIETFRRSLE